MSSREFSKSPQLVGLLSTLIRAHLKSCASESEDMVSAVQIALRHTATRNLLVEAQRLNLALERYYQGSGRATQLILEFSAETLIPRVYWRD